LLIDPDRIPLALYVHVPWCVRKCPYCDFNSHAVRDGIPEARYVDAVIADLEREAALTTDRQIFSVFFGGGTPSLLSGNAIRGLLEGIRERLDLRADAEISLEANAGAVDEGHFAAYREAGVNRLSLGVQSFDDTKLGTLGRIHSAAEAVAAYDAALGSGFDNINLDLMYALPAQTVEEALADLEQAVNLAPTHVSWYQLTIEPNTVFYRNPPPDLPDDDSAAAIAEAGQALLAGARYDQYEVSAYATPGRPCTHNLNYWQFGDYIGVGAGAHGKLTLPDGRIERRRKVRHPDAYMSHSEAGDAVSGKSRLQDEDLVLEFMMNVLRLNGGVPAKLFEDRTGLNYEAFAPRLDLLKMRGLVEPRDDVIRATALGRRYLNDLLAVFA
jgi:putative oxygen-independent coproporphyrinogen III oxidase